jgi:hypothetical protein
VVARLAHDVLIERWISRSIRAERAESARGWLSSTTLPPTVRPALSTLVDASAGDAQEAAAALGSVIAVTATFLDAAARSELDRLAALLGAQALVR